MNRQIWTNLKQQLSRIGDNQNPQCLLCEQVENTHHLLFECETYSSKIWENLGFLINRLLSRKGLDIRIQFHAFNVLYNNDFVGIDSNINDQLLYLIQEIKRNIVYRRYVRSTLPNNFNIRYNDRKIYSHIVINLDKTIYQLTIMGGNATTLQEIRELAIEQYI